MAFPESVSHQPLPVPPQEVQPPVEPPAWRERVQQIRGRVQSSWQQTREYAQQKLWPQAQAGIKHAMPRTLTTDMPQSAFTSSAPRARMWRARMLHFMAIGLVAFTFLGILMSIVLVAWVANDIPNPDQIRNRAAGGTKILDRNGDLLYDATGNEMRQPITMDQVPEYLKQATVAVEDKDFYTHSGFDPLTPFRIGYNYIFRRGRVVGGSTLTQQLVKMLLLTNERTATRKLKELILAIEIERQFSKEEILQMYLNEAPYGGQAIGVGAASQMFFKKDVKDLTLVESAILAGLPQRPSAYSPYLGRTTDDGQPLWQWRTEGVLRRMREDGYITPELEEQALEEMKNVQFSREQVSIRAPHFVFYVLDALEELYGAESVRSGGLTVRTSLDLPFYEETQAIVKEEIDKVVDLNITNGAVIVMDPRNGEILSMVGSKDYFAEDIPGQFNVAVDGLRQPGSSIKPVTYATALMRGYTPASMVVDAATIFAPNDSADPYEPRNYDGKFRGPMTLRRALAESNNVVAVKLLASVGVENMLGTAYDLGFPTLEPTAENLRRFGLAVTLGGAEVHLIDTVTAYSAFANNGRTITPVSILEVKDTQDKVIYQHRAVAGRQVLSEGVAYLMNSILSDDIARSGAFGTNSQLNIENRPIAVKTGTTNDQRDNWTVGWSQSTIVGVWVGNNDNSQMKRVASGVTGASPIWRRVMQAAIASGRTTDPWAMPDTVEKVSLDVVSGYRSHDDLPAREELVLKGSLPSGRDPVHQKVRLCKGQRKLATAADLARNEWEEKVFINLYENDVISQDGKNRWQEGINGWISQQPDPGAYQAPTELCDSADQVVVDLRSPENERKYDTENIEIEVNVASEEKLQRVEIYVNGQRRESFSSAPYKTKLKLERGRYEIYAKAIREDGKEGQSGTAKIGTGGEDWKVPEATPTPTPAPTATPTPAPTAAPTIPPQILNP
jgi:penicillin-binding protein 1C